MKLLVNIGEMNSFQLKKIQALGESSHLEIVYDDQVACDLILSTKWQDHYNHPHLKALFVPFTGLNRFPVESLKAQGVQVINTHAKASLVAERALALCLTMMGKVMTYHNALKEEGRWLTRENWGKELWYSLQNKRVGIIGMGHIGQAISSYLKAFNCQILNLERDKPKALGDWYLSLEDLLETSEVLFIACELNPSTKDLINKQNMHLLKNTWLINIGRGGIIEEEALYLSLKTYLLGAAIDVWYNYPKDGTCSPSNYPIHTLDNLVYSPHASCHALEFRDAYYDDIIEKIKIFERTYVGE